MFSIKSAWELYRVCLYTLQRQPGNHTEAALYSTEALYVLYREWTVSVYSTEAECVLKRGYLCILQARHCLCTLHKLLSTLQRLPGYFV